MGCNGPHEALSTKQEAFCQEYVVCDSPKEAAVLAGYKESGYCYKLAEQPKIKQRIAELRKEIEEKVLSTKEGVLNGLWAEAHDKEVPPAVRIKAFELLGKYHALWVERAEIGGPGAFVERPVSAITAEIKDLIGLDPIN